MKIFNDKLCAVQAASQSFVCIGLDPDVNKLPHHLRQKSNIVDAIYDFHAAIIEATSDLVCAYKPNLAFFEIFGSAGWALLEKTLALIPQDKVVIADAKRGDIGNTARMYAQAFFEQLNCDAVTVAPYMGADSVLPFLEYADKATFVLGLTSNTGSQDFEELRVNSKYGEMPLYQVITRQVAEWNETAKGTAGLVVGATKPEQLFQLRDLAPTLPFLIPGVGAQGGDAESAIQGGTMHNGLVLINSGRQILYASSGTDFAEAARKETIALNALLNAARSA